MVNERDNQLNQKDSPLVRLRDLSKSFGRVEAVKSINLDIKSRDFLAILGPSGCGKTTLLRLIGGFAEPSNGTVEIGGNDVTRLGPERRPTNMVFQGYGLFPHMTVRENIAYGLKIQKVSQSEREQRVDDVIGLVRLEELADRGTGELSGGQQQRAALARAIVMRPQVLLLDEPLAALDLKLRQAMQEELRRIHNEIGGTFVFVTHDQGEALALSNRIAVMDEGNIIQEGGPEDIYASPESRFVSTFIGEANILSGRRQNSVVTLAAGLDLPSSSGPDGAVILVIRPEAVQILSDNSQADVRTEGTIVDKVYLGAYVRFQVQLSSDELITANVPTLNLSKEYFSGDRIAVGWGGKDHRILMDS